MSGTELISKIRALKGFNLVPIVVLSSVYRPDLIRGAFEAGANKCVSKMDCTPNLALEIVEQIFSGEVVGLYPSPLGASPMPTSMPPPPIVKMPKISFPGPETAQPPSAPGEPLPFFAQSATIAMPKLFAPPSPPKFGASTAAPAAPAEPAAAPEKILTPAPTIKMPKTESAGQSIPAPTPTPILPGTSHTGAQRIVTAADRVAPEAAGETAGPARPDFGSDATSSFRFEIRQEFLKRVPQIQADLRERVGSLVRSKSTTEQLSLLQGFNSSITSLVGLAGITGFTRIAHLAGAMEALIKDLQKKPKQMTSSVLRTIAHASDCLNVLFRDINQGAQEIPQSLLILAVDDEPISRRTISVALAKANLRCICVEESKMALTMLGENQFDLIFLDAEMPEMNGFELCTELRKTATNKNTPVIFVTSLTNFEVRAQSSLAGANDLIAKPFLMMELAVKSLTYLLRPKSIVDAKGQSGGV
jgi:CheY-like chemotaxis protein